MRSLPHSFQPHIVLTPGVITAEAKQQTHSQYPSSHNMKLQLLHSDPAAGMVLLNKESQHDFLVHSIGWLFSCASALWLQHHFNLSGSSILQQDLTTCTKWLSLLQMQLVSGFWVTAAAAVASDLLGCQGAAAATPGGGRNFWCGNFGIMLADACDKSVDIVKVCY